MKHTFLTFLLLACAPYAWAQTDIEAFLKKYQSQYLQGASYKIKTQDAPNGYALFCVPSKGEQDCDMTSDMYAVGLWKTAKGEKIWGIFKHACGGVGCWADDMKALRFYDAQLQDITAKVYDAAATQKVADDFELTSPTNAAEKFDAAQKNIYAEIPQKGTSIKLTVGVAGIASQTFGTLVFDKVTGKFKLSKN